MAAIKKIKYKSGYKYQLAEMYLQQVPIYDRIIESKYIFINQDGLLRILDGYSWDGPSGPTIDTHTFMRGSLVHDALYQLIREGHLSEAHRLMADQLLREICLEDGMSRLRAWYVYHSVRLFADSACDPRNKKKLMTAPKRINTCHQIK